MKKKLTAAMALILAICCVTTGCARVDSGEKSSEIQTATEQTPTEQTTAEQTPAEQATATETVSAEEAPTEKFFSDSDYQDMTKETPNATITLDGDTGTISDTTRGSSGSEVTITSKGIYYITGESDGVTIVVNDEKKSGNIYLIFDGVTMTNSSACVDVEAADKVIIQCMGDTTLTSTAADNAAIYAKDDLTLSGSGNLTVVSSKNGIACNDDLRLTGGTVTVLADNHGLKAHDSLCIDGAELNVTSAGDGLKVDSDDGTGILYMISGAVTVIAQGDGIDVGSDLAAVYTGYVNLEGGTLDITSGGGSDNPAGETSQKGIKCAGEIFISDGVVNISGADDAVNSAGSVNITGGALTLSTSDDGITTEGDLAVSGGEITLTKSYEGIEAANIAINGGKVSVISSDDGMNAEKTVTISGGEIYVNSGGDGIDSNGSIYVSGGTLIIEGPTVSNNGALDKGDSPDCVISITGGRVLATGSAGMAKGFDFGSQYSSLVTLSGRAGDTITVSDGFTFTASKDFETVVYSSPNFTESDTISVN